MSRRWNRLTARIIDKRTELSCNRENAPHRPCNRPNRVISGAGRRTNKPARARVLRIAPEIADVPDSLAGEEGVCAPRRLRMPSISHLKSVNHLIGTAISAHCNRSDTTKTEGAGPSPPSLLPAVAAATTAAATSIMAAEARFAGPGLVDLDFSALELRIVELLYCL